MLLGDLQLMPDFDESKATLLAVFLMLFEHVRRMASLRLLRDVFAAKNQK